MKDFNCPCVPKDIAIPYELTVDTTYVEKKEPPSKALKNPYDVPMPKAARDLLKAKARGLSVGALEDFIKKFNGDKRFGNDGLIALRIAKKELKSRSIK